jgi:hypothetical protein
MENPNEKLSEYESSPKVTSLTGRPEWELKTITTVEPFVRSLRSLLRAVEAGASIAIRDSPISQIAEISGELIYQLADLLKGKADWGCLPNPGLKFVESFEVPSDVEEDCFLDPVGSYKLSKGRKLYSTQQRYYESATDPLGNPLQVEISFEDPSKSIKPKDRYEMADLLIDLSHFLFAMQRGQIDWHFMRQVRKAFAEHTSPSTTPKKSMDVQKGKDIVINFQRDGTTMPLSPEEFNLLAAQIREAEISIVPGAREYNDFLIAQDIRNDRREKKRAKQKAYRARRAQRRKEQQAKLDQLARENNTPSNT